MKFWSENIMCPKCGKVQFATVLECKEHILYVHMCETCKFIIYEWDWKKCCQ